VRQHRQELRVALLDLLPDLAQEALTLPTPRTFTANGEERQGEDYHREQRTQRIG
jgi:hypothetical protein